MATATTSRRPVRAVSPPPEVRSVGFADRVALRVGLALIIWSRRTHRRGLPPDRTRGVQVARAAREAAWQRDAALLGRWR